MFALNESIQRLTRRDIETDCAVDFELPELPSQRRKMLWCVFWIALLGTPLLTLISPLVSFRLIDELPRIVRSQAATIFPFATISGLVAAGFTSGFLYVRLTARSRIHFVRDAIMFGFLFLGLIAAIIFFAFVLWQFQ